MKVHCSILLRTCICVELPKYLIHKTTYFCKEKNQFVCNAILLEDSVCPFQKDEASHVYPHTENKTHENTSNKPEKLPSHLTQKKTGTRNTTRNIIYLPENKNFYQKKKKKSVGRRNFKNPYECFGKVHTLLRQCTFLWRNISCWWGITAARIGDKSRHFLVTFPIDEIPLFSFALLKELQWSIIMEVELQH